MLQTPLDIDLKCYQHTDLNVFLIIFRAQSSHITDHRHKVYTKYVFCTMIMYRRLFTSIRL